MDSIVFVKSAEIRKDVIKILCLCEKCGKSMDEKQFYTYKDGQKTEMCKQCLTMHIDNFNPDTFLWLLEKMDVPYVPAEWNVLRDRAYAKDPAKMNGMSVFGKYLSKMKLKQWKEYAWADTERLQALEEERARTLEGQRKEHEAIIKERFDNGEITEAEYKTLMSTRTQNEAYVNSLAQNFTGVGANQFPEANFMPEEEMTDLGAELTEDDKLYLAMKWGRLYKPSEWVLLEKDYNEMLNSFDIQDADTMNTLILICKTNLKMNQAIDMGDLDGFQKLSRVSESLRKSAKFTAAQNKEQKNDFVDSVGELVAMCEREGFIPRYATDIPQDKVDLTLKDMNNYIYKLVTQDLGFGQQIEDSLKKIQIQKEMNDAESKVPEGETLELEDDDYIDFLESVEEQKEKDLEHFEEE